MVKEIIYLRNPEKEEIGIEELIKEIRSFVNKIFVLFCTLHGDSMGLQPANSQLPIQYTVWDYLPLFTLI